MGSPTGDKESGAWHMESDKLKNDMHGAGHISF